MHCQYLNLHVCHGIHTHLQDLRFVVLTFPQLAQLVDELCNLLLLQRRVIVALDHMLGTDFSYSSLTFRDALFLSL